MKEDIEKVIEDSEAEQGELSITSNQFQTYQFDISPRMAKSLGLPGEGLTETIEVDNFSPDPCKWVSARTGENFGYFRISQG